MGFLRRRICSMLLAASFCFITLPVLAQSTSVSGEVMDSTSAVVADAVVKLTDTATRQVRTSATNGAG